MSEQGEQSGRDADAAGRRLRDFVILTFGAIGILTLLLFTSAVGLVEWLTGSIVMLAGSLAYYVGSLPVPETLQPARLSVPTTDTPERSHSEVIAPCLLAMPFPTLLIGSDKRLQTVNDTARELFRIEGTPEQFAVAALRHPDLLDAADRVSASGAPELVEFSLNDEVDAWMAHLRAGPETGSVMIILEDLTAVRRAELARADFLANASHELRTPLTAVGGFIETMRGPAKDDKGSWDGFLEIMYQQTERMKRLVSDLLSLSRIESSEHQSPSTRIDIVELAGRGSVMLQPIAQAANVTLTLAAPDTPVDIIADADELMQVIQNLAINAIKYAADGSAVAITVGTSSTMRQAAEACGRQIPDANRALLLDPRASAQVPAIWLRVEDHGEGIPARHLPRLGERFYRSDESRGGEIDGTGLGLAIVKHIMAKHRGGLAIESIEDQGTAVGIWMPRAPAT